ncbi:amidohydrolase family protein (plasmid) [Phyllobacterium sp. 628]|uniref:amidohydrolase family protein n=1 Tax=Phyllobacterium sp. 628 TaxID=2718938 RepID=UPI0016623F4B|nr:amidohydrolase family protein [Phyllobacterium sp. 628]QND54471.1 amidohydrolase family protein [Phyllobacterium sp. 628]
MNWAIISTNCSNRASSPPLRHVQPGLFKRAVEAVGPNRVLFATDYPYQYRPEGDARRFVKSLECNDADKAQFAYENWERLIDGNKRCDAGPITSQRC